MEARNIGSTIVFLSGLLMVGCASKSPSLDVLAEIRHAAGETALTDPRAVLDSLGVKADFRATLYADHVYLTIPKQALLGTPYEGIDILPFIGRKPTLGSHNLAERSQLRIRMATNLCITKADVDYVFGPPAHTGPLIEIHRETGLYSNHDLPLRHGRLGTVTFSFPAPQECAESLSVTVPLPQPTQ